jgi:hypothetical protein
MGVLALGYGFKTSIGFFKFAFFGHNTGIVQ